MKKLSLLIALLAGLVLAVGGCSSSTDPADVDTGNYEDFGDYTAENEESADFGDTDLAALLDDTQEEEYDDPVALAPVVDSVENEENPDIFCLRMVWGNLPRDSGVTELTDWSGSLTISRGAIVVSHIIKFEPGQDYLLPRYNDEGFYIPEELHWVSKTSWHLDGLVTRLYIPPSVTDEVVTVTYHSEQLDITFAMDQLESLDTLITVGFGNAISFQSIRCEPGAGKPTRGHLAGIWTRDETGKGIFYGRWMSSGGILIGSIKGEWGTDSTGQNVFVGKYVDLSGRFEGFVKGVWGNDPHYIGFDHGGLFKGRIFNANRNPIGVLGGHYSMGAARPGGFFAGRWCVGSRCNIAVP